MKWWIATMLVAASLTGCFKSPPRRPDAANPSSYVGVYRVAKRAHSVSGCNRDLDIMSDGPGYLSVRATKPTAPAGNTAIPTPGVSAITYAWCRRPTSCMTPESDARNLRWDPDHHAWIEQESEASQLPYHGLANRCLMKLTRVILTPTANGIRLQRHDYSGKIILEGDETCDATMAAAHLPELRCRRSEVVDAVRRPIR